MTKQDWHNELFRLVGGKDPSHFDLKRWDECRFVFADWLEENGYNDDEIMVTRAGWKYLHGYDSYDRAERGEQLWRIKTAVTKSYLGNADTRYLSAEWVLHFPPFSVCRNNERFENGWVEYFHFGPAPAPAPADGGHPKGSVIKQIAYYIRNGKEL